MPLEARDSAFYVDGKKVQLLSGAIHYFRVVPEYWEDRLMRLKACGLNCVETQVFSLSKGMVSCAIVACNFCIQHAAIIAIF